LLVPNDLLDRVVPGRSPNHKGGVLMVETKRMNQTMYCDGCGSYVNPFVVQNGFDDRDVKIECPNCRHSWEVEFDPEPED
jgi:hypothetical protein